MSDIKTCMGIENTKEALDCVKTAIANSDDKCKPKLVLLVQKDCEYCREEEEAHKSDIDSGVIQRLDIETREGLTIIEKNNLDYVPALILLDCNDNILMS